MSPRELKRLFRAGEIDKPAYIREMLALHATLFDYAEFIRETEIASIEITDGSPVFHFRDMPYSMTCPPGQARVAPIEILNFDRYEPHETAVVARLLRGCTTILDVGANVGWFSLWFAHQCPGAAIHAFEPLPQSLKFLRANVTANALESRIATHPFGLSEEAGTFDFFSYPTGSTNASMLNVSGAKDAVKTVCETRRMDDWCGQAGVTPDFVKCDVEGAEFQVFKGGVRTLAQARPIVFTEMLRKWSAPFGYHPNEVIAFFDRLGYDCHAIGARGLSVFAGMTDASTETNFVFLHREKHAALAEGGAA